MCLVDSSVKRLDVRTQISEMSILVTGGAKDGEKKSQVGAEFGSAWLANDHTGSGRWGELWRQRGGVDWQPRGWLVSGSLGLREEEVAWRGCKGQLGANWVQGTRATPAGSPRRADQQQLCLA